MWIENCWQVAAFSKDIGTEILARTFLNKKTILYRTSQNEVVAMADQCPHRLLPLSMGAVVGDVVRCHYHGLCFDKKGDCVSVPGQQQIPSQAKVKVYPTIEKYKLVWIWMGDPALADPALVPDVHWFDSPEWVPSEGYHLIKANYQLLNDNLLDLSHETFVHPHTIGNGAVAESPLTVTVGEGKVRAFREMLDCEPPPYYVAAADSVGRIDRWHTTIFTPPGFHVIESGSKPAGMSREQALAEGKIRERNNLNLITPETETSSHYFWAPTRNYSLEDAKLTDFIREQAALTFEQDKEVLEAQQAAFGDGEVRFPVTLRADAGGVQGRRLVLAMINKEQAAGSAAGVGQ
jgi:phenylpropionate dioxygenase-like ring-hydroxylating dioxygenase large terminal subunit